MSAPFTPEEERHIERMLRAREVAAEVRRRASSPSLGAVGVPSVGDAPGADSGSASGGLRRDPEANEVFDDLADIG